MSRDLQNNSAGIVQLDPRLLDEGSETLFPGGVFDLSVISSPKGTSVDVHDHTVVKTISGPVGAEMPREFMIQSGGRFSSMSASSSGVLGLTAVEREVIEDPVGVKWIATMPRCPVTLDSILPLLKLMIDKDNLPENQLIQHVQFAIFASLVKMLETFQLAGIVHCDLKPENIGLAPDQDETEHDGTQCAFDFGVAKSVGEAFVIPSGTPAYMAPEIFYGEPASAEQDIYAMGRVMEAVVRGEKPANPSAGTAIFSYFADQMNQYGAQRAAELQKLSGSADALVDDRIRQAGLEKKAQFCEAISRCTDFKACLALVIGEMCTTFPEYRPVLACLTVAEEKLCSLLSPLQSGYSVAGFFQQVCESAKPKRNAAQEMMHLSLPSFPVYLSKGRGC